MSYPYDSSSPPRMGGIAYAAAFHLALIYALVNGPGGAVVNALHAPLMTQAEDMGETGTTLLQFLIGADGHVAQARIAASSGHGPLDQTALRALSACKLKPALNANGQPQKAWTSIPYVWTLN